MRSIQTVEEFRELTRNDKNFCAVFSADWCPDCQVIKGVLPGLETEYGDRFDFAMVNRDKFMSLAETYQVMGIPSFLVFRRGEVVDTFISSLGKTRLEITRFLDRVYQNS